MKIITWNVNGIRAIHRKGELKKFLETEKPDILCLQEIKAQEENIPEDFKDIPGYFCYFSHGYRKGYAGVAVFAKIKPKKIEDKIGFDRFDKEGRVLKLTYPEFILYNFYIPNGGRDKKDMEYKLALYDYLVKGAKLLVKELSSFQFQKRVIIAGDFNVAHQEIDLARPKENQNNIMFTKEERERIGQLVSMGFVDTFRLFHKESGHYTWWLYFANARARNIGWRIDYVFVSKNLAGKVKKAFILPKVMGSDHCPAGVEI